jgi:hypothetical protein
MARESALSGGRSAEGAARIRERDEEAVPLGIHLDASVARESFSEEAPVVGEYPCVAVPELVDKAGRALDVREEQGHGARGKVTHGPPPKRRTLPSLRLDGRPSRSGGTTRVSTPIRGTKLAD